MKIFTYQVKHLHAPSRPKANKPPVSRSATRKQHGATQRAARKRKLCAIRDGWWCWYCDEPLVEGATDHRQPTLDHVIPLGRGGGWELENCRLACGPCNNAKGDMTELEYRKHKEQAA